MRIHRLIRIDDIGSSRNAVRDRDDVALPVDVTDRRRALYRFFAVSLNEVFALISRAMLDRDAAAERTHSFDVPLCDGFDR